MMEQTHGEVDRLAAAKRLFTSYCLPMARGIMPDEFDGFVEVHIPNALWVEPKSKMGIALSERRCKITDILQPLSEAEIDTLAAWTAAMIAEEFPQLALDPGARLDSWRHFYAWVEGDLHHPQRWGVTFASFAFGGDEQTFIQLVLPRD